MGTIQDPNADREWLKHSYPDTSTNPYSIDARTEMMGRVATGRGRLGRAVAAVIVLAFGIYIVVKVLF